MWYRAQVGGLVAAMVAVTALLALVGLWFYAPLFAIVPTVFAVLMVVAGVSQARKSLR